MSDSRSTPFLTAATMLVIGGLLGSSAARPRPQEPINARVEPTLVSAPDTTFDGRVRLASIFPAVGRYAISGIQSSRGARLAVEDINLMGGVLGRRLKLLEYSTGSYFVDARHAADVAASEGGVLAIIGANSSSLSMAIAEVAERQAVVQISNVSTAQDLTWDPKTGHNRRYVFRVCASDVVMGTMLAQFARDDLEARRVAVLYEIGRAYSAKLARSFVESFDPGGTEGATAEFFYLPLEIDFRPQLQEIASFGADVLFVPGSFTDTTLIAMQLEALNLPSILLGADGWSNRLLFARGGPSRPAFFSDHCSIPPDFDRQYRQAFAEEPQGCRAILAYDAVLAFAEALESLGPLGDRDLLQGLAETRDRLRAALEVTETEGRSGAIRFDANGDSRRGVAILRVERQPDGSYRSDLDRWLGESAGARP